MKFIHKIKNIYYGWFIVGAAFTIMAIGWGGVFNVSSLFLKPISEDLGFTRSAISATATVRSASLMIVSFLSGKIFKKVDIIKLMRFCTITLVISYYLHSMANSLIMFYLLTVIVSVSIGLIAVLPLSLILSNWFIKNRGLVIGIAFMGSGVGGMVLSSLAGGWIELFGWRMAYKILAAIMLVGITPCTFFLIRIHPKDLGLMPYGAIDDMTSNSEEIDYEGVMLSEAFKSIKFWSLCISSILIMLGINGLMMTVSPHLTDIGYSISFSANIVALVMGSLAIGKLLLGKLFDSLGVRKAITISCISTLLGVIGLIYSNYYIGLMTLIIFAGVGSAFGTVANSVIVSDLYGKKDYSSILGFLTAVGSFGGMIGPILSGYFYDISGSYLTYYKIAVFLGVISIIMYQFIFMSKNKNYDLSI